MPRCRTHLIQPIILGCFHLKVRESYRKPVLITERPPSLYTVTERGNFVYQDIIFSLFLIISDWQYIFSHSYYIISDWFYLLFKWRFRQERYRRSFGIPQLALLYLLSQEPKWNVPLGIWAYRKGPPVITEILRLPSDGIVMLFMVCARLK